MILFLAANPTTTDRLALDREARAIHLELKRSGFRDRFDFQTRWAAEPLDLLREVRELKPTVVHFSGHGVARSAAHERSGTHRDVGGHDAASGATAGDLYFHRGDGSGQRVSADAIAQTLEAAGPSVKLVVLNACYTVPIAEALCAHVDCVVGVSGAICRGESSFVWVHKEASHDCLSFPCGRFRTHRWRRLLGRQPGLRP